MSKNTRSWIVLVLLGGLVGCVEGEDCSHDGQTYTDGQSWTAASCDECECENGVTYCTAAECDSGETSSDSGR